jgi:penicillin-binding protein 1C
VSSAPQRTPLAGTIIALDPDIPAARQKVVFIYRGSEEDLQWVLNEKTIEEKRKAMGWIPQTGKYFLALQNGQGETLDTVQFEVRGTPEQRNIKCFVFRVLLEML